jgi:cytochrome c biogenesis protein CcdA
MTKAMGPLLVVAGLFLLEVLTVVMPGISVPEKQQNRMAESGAPGAFFLGLIFALAFCPVSAALFFGSLIPLALSNKAGILLPFVYGIGTGLPVIVFAFAIALGVKTVSRWFHRLAKAEYYTRRVTGIIFILAGLYYIKVYLLKIP